MISDEFFGIIHMQNYFPGGGRWKGGSGKRIWDGEAEGRGEGVESAEKRVISFLRLSL